MKKYPLLHGSRMDSRCIVLETILSVTIYNAASTVFRMQMVIKNTAKSEIR